MIPIQRLGSISSLLQVSQASFKFDSADSTLNLKKSSDTYRRLDMLPGL